MVPYFHLRMLMFHVINVIGAIDSQYRCKHYHSELDIVALKMKCCGCYYGCYYCHEEAADHKPEVWPRREWRTKAAACGQCHTELTIEEYLSSGYRCPACEARFNPGCKNHNHLYFECL